MAKTMQGYVRRARIAPGSKLSPGTWMALRSASPWVTLAVSLASLFAAGPITSVFFLFLGCMFYLTASQWVPKPIFPRQWLKDKGPEEAINLGRDEYGLPVILPVKTLVRHVLLLGTTGSGKTTTIRTIGESIMKLGGGFCFVDGKADVTDTYAVLYEIVRDTDREEDLLVLNFLNPQQSHSFNFLMYGDADFLAEVMTGFMKDASGDNAYWQEKGKVLMKTILSVLVYKRDNGEAFDGFVLTVEEVRKCFNFEELLNLMNDGRLPDYDRLGLPVKQKLKYYLDELGPWRELVEARRGGKVSPAAQEIYRQHAFYVQQWGPPFELLTGAFAPIFNTRASDIDIVDVVTNSRILVVLLPSLSYSLSTLRALGRVVLSTFKIALTTALGKDVVGDYDELSAEARRNRPAVPFILIPDEYGSYAVEGFDTVLAQARSLGMGILISVQELASLMKASEADAKRLIGNTNIKIIMKIEDNDTAEYVAKRAGEEFYLTPAASGKTDSFGVSEAVGNFDGGYQYQKAARIEARDLASLDIGEGIILFGDEVRRFRTRYIPNKGDLREMRLMRFVDKSLKSLRSKMAALARKARDRIDESMVQVYSWMTYFGISIREERCWRKFTKLRAKYLMDEGGVSIDGSEAAILTGMFEAEYITREELDEMKDVVLKRLEYQKFTDELYAKANKDYNFYNKALAPSTGANEFLRYAFTQADAIVNKSQETKSNFKETMEVAAGENG